MVTVDQLQGESFSSQCSLKGIRIPLYRFGCSSADSDENDESLLDSILLAQWEDRMWKGLFRYDVTTSEIKVIGGRRKFIAQFNEGCISDYATKLGMSETRHQEDVFEFSWTEREEGLLFSVACGEKTNPELVLAAAVPDCALLITINASPVEYGHIFLTPHCSKILHQTLDASSLELALRVAVEVNNCSFRLFYDYSPSASHIYFQACYFQTPLPVEFMPSDTFCGEGREEMHISSVSDYPIKTLVFETNHFKLMLEVIAEICSCLRGKRIMYNLLISEHGRKIFLFLQLPTSKISCPLSAWECGGYFLFKSRSEFDQATEKTLLKQLSTLSIDDESFRAVKLLCCSIASKFAS